jgi:hypothetical protein
MCSRSKELMPQAWIRSIAIFLLAFLHPAAAAAQTISVGVRGGPTIAGVLWEDPYAADGMGGLRRYHAGATITASLSRWFAYRHARIRLPGASVAVEVRVTHANLAAPDGWTHGSFSASVPCYRCGWDR